MLFLLIMFFYNSLFTYSSLYYSHSLIFIVIFLIFIFVFLIFGFLFINNVFKNTVNDIFIELLWTFIPLLVVILFGIPLFYYIEFNSFIFSYFYANQWFFSSSLAAINVLNIELFPCHYNSYFFLTSNDVIHAFFLPHIWAKIDMVPGVISTLSSFYSLSGFYKVYCAQICGLNHHSMYCFLYI